MPKHKPITTNHSAKSFLLKMFSVSNGNLWGVEAQAGAQAEIFRDE